MIAWNVFHKGRLIDIVFFTADCDADYVRNSLIRHDGYMLGIKVEKVIK